MYKPNLGEPILNQKSEQTKGIIAICLLFTVLGIGFIFGAIRDKSRQKHLIVFNGYITSVMHAGKSGWKVNYLYSVNNKIYNGNGGTPRFKNQEDNKILEEKYFPIVIDSTDFSNVDMLFDSLSFTRYGLQYPDSLRWLQDYLKR